MENDYIIYEAFEDEERIDKYLATYYPSITRSLIQNYIKDGNVKVNGKNIKCNYILKDEDNIEITFPDVSSSVIEEENIPLDIVYEDNDVIVVNKPTGMVVHPAVGNKNGTLVNALLYHCKDLSGINGEARPGIVHRIDKDTSGLLVACKNDNSHKTLSLEFQNKEVNKIYYAICVGNIPHNVGVINAPIGRDPMDRQKMAIVDNGKEAITHFKVIDRFDNYSLVEIKLETGRTHQIRVHMKYIGFPVAGDPIYGLKKEIAPTGQFLHAKKLGFIHPTKNEYMEFDSELPSYFKEFIESHK